jgi:hypothetical protein
MLRVITYIYVVLVMNWLYSQAICDLTWFLVQLLRARGQTNCLLKCKIRMLLHFTENIINEYSFIFVFRYVTVLTNFM